jgi:hypothetical protein
MGFFSPNLSFKGSNCFLSAQKGAKKVMAKKLNHVRSGTY